MAEENKETNSLDDLSKLKVDDKKSLSLMSQKLILLEGLTQLEEEKNLLLVSG